MRMTKPRKHLKFASSAPREFSLKQIALQAGVGLATVDRVLHGREGVSPSMRRRVEQALRELGRQSEQTVLAGRKFMIDLVMEAPRRFTQLVAEALEAEMPSFARRCSGRDCISPRKCRLRNWCAFSTAS